jgi:hypothetical protein
VTHSTIFTVHAEQQQHLILDAQANKVPAAANRTNAKQICRHDTAAAAAERDRTEEQDSCDVP